MTVYQNHESTSGDSFLETTDLYQKLSEQSPAIKAIVDAELSKQGLIENKDLAILAMSTLISVLSGKGFDLSAVSSTTKLLTGFSISLYATGTSTATTAAIEGDNISLEDIAVSLVSTLVSFAADSSMGTVFASIGVGVLGQFVTCSLAAYSIGKLINKGYEGIKDKNAIFQAEVDNSYSIECTSGLNEFLSENWDILKEFHENGKDWSVEQEGDKAGLMLTFKLNESGDPPLTIETSHTTYPDTELFSTLLNKIGADFNFIVQGAQTEYIENLTILTLEEMISKAETQEGLFAMVHLAPYVPRNAAASFLSEIDSDDFSSQYKTDRAMSLYYSIHAGEEVFDHTSTIVFEDKSLEENGLGYNGQFHSTANRNIYASPATHIRHYIFGTDSDEVIEGDSYDV